MTFMLYKQFLPGICLILLLCAIVVLVDINSEGAGGQKPFTQCHRFYVEYSEIPLLRPPKIKTFYPLKTLFARFKKFFSSFSTPCVPLIRDHLWDCPKVVFKTTFGQSQRWS